MSFIISNTESIQKLISTKKDDKNRLILNEKDYKLIDNYKTFLDYKKEQEFDYFLKEQLTHYKKKKPKMLKIDFSKENLLSHIEDLKEQINETQENYNNSLFIH